jgi:hypothetical protein
LLERNTQLLSEQVALQQPPRPMEIMAAILFFQPLHQQAVDLELPVKTT